MKKYGNHGVGKYSIDAEDADNFGGLFGAIFERFTRFRQNLSFNGGIDGQSSEHESEVLRLRSHVASMSLRKF